MSDTERIDAAAVQAAGLLDFALLMDRDPTVRITQSYLRAVAATLIRQGDENARLKRELAAAESAALKLAAFKNWVHDYLDQQGVPHHPPGLHGAEGCRIGDRMDWLMALLRPAVRPDVPVVGDPLVTLGGES